MAKDKKHGKDLPRYRAIYGFEGIAKKNYGKMLIQMNKALLYKFTKEIKK